MQLELTKPLVSSRYVVSSLEMLVAEDYLIIYMNGATPRSKMPGISWLKKCYQMIDRRSGKSLIYLIDIWWIKHVFIIALNRHISYFQLLNSVPHHQTHMVLILTDMKG